MADKLGVGSEVQELKLGSSFDSNSKVAFHSMRYDFKPASVDVTKVSEVSIGKNHSVTVKVPHVEGSGTSHTVYKGNKRPCQKECVLIINHNTGEITLEKLANQIGLKKTRIEGSSKASQLNRPVTPSEQIKQMKDKKSSPSKSKKSSQQGQGHSQSHSKSEGHHSSHSRKEPSPSPSHTSETSMVSKSPIGQISDSSSSSDDSISSDSEDETPPKPSGDPPTKSPKDRKYASMLSMDLQLSESGSDSD